MSKLRSIRFVCCWLHLEVILTLSTEQLPVGKWPKDLKLKEIGEFQLAQLNEAIASYTPALLSRGLGWNRNEMEVLCAKVREELKDSSIHLYQNVHIVYGKRPPVL